MDAVASEQPVKPERTARRERSARRKRVAEQIHRSLRVRAKPGATNALCEDYEWDIERLTPGVQEPLARYLLVRGASLGPEITLSFATVDAQKPVGYHSYHTQSKAIFAIYDLDADTVAPQPVSYQLFLRVASGNDYAELRVRPRPLLREWNS